jgi:hypothetical protein
LRKSNAFSTPFFSPTSRTPDIAERIFQLLSEAFGALTKASPSKTRTPVCIVFSIIFILFFSYAW